MTSMTWGELPSEACFAEQCELTNSIPFRMTLVPDDYTVVAEAINQGIDSHLEAIFLDGEVEQTGGPLPKGKLAIADAKSLRTLVRRLVEIGYRQQDEAGERRWMNESPSAHSLASDIMQTLGYEWI